MIVWKLNQIMALRRFSGKQLAEKLEIHPNTISRIRKTDQMPTIDGNLLEKLCLALDCSPSDLIEYIPPEGQTNSENILPTELSFSELAAIFTQTTDEAIKATEAEASTNQNPQSSVIRNVAFAAIILVAPLFVKMVILIAKITTEKLSAQSDNKKTHRTEKKK